MDMPCSQTLHWDGPTGSTVRMPHRSLVMCHVDHLSESAAMPSRLREHDIIGFVCQRLGVHNMRTTHGLTSVPDLKSSISSSAASSPPVRLTSSDNFDLDCQLLCFLIFFLTAFVKRSAGLYWRHRFMPLRFLRLPGQLFTCAL